MFLRFRMVGVLIWQIESLLLRRILNEDLIDFSFEDTTNNIFDALNSSRL